MVEILRHCEKRAGRKGGRIKSINQATKRKKRMKKDNKKTCTIFNVMIVTVSVKLPMVLVSPTLAHLKFINKHSVILSHILSSSSLNPYHMIWWAGMTVL